MNEARHADEPAQQTGPGLSIGEIYHVLFRHKWKVAVIWALTFVAAAAFVLTHPPSYKSEAKLLIRYVQETKSLTIHSPGNDPQILSPDSHGESIIHTETEILSSLDLAREVAAIVGPENLLGKGAKSNDLDRAALLISRNLLVQAPGKGNVIQMVFQHSDPKVIQPVLRNLMDGYRAKHVAIHQAVGILDEFLKEQTEKLRRQLLKTQQELAAVKNNAGIVSLEETKKSYAVQIAKIQDELLGLEADLAQRNSILTNAEKLLPQSDVAAAEIGAPLQKLEEYKRLCSQLDSLLNQERGLWKYTDQNPIVTSTREQIAYVRKLKKDMEAENPKLATLSVPSSVTNGSALFDLATERSKITAMQTKKNVLSSQLDRIFASATNLNQAESLFAQLERRKEAEEADRRGYASSLEQSHAAEATGAGKININEVQSPSPPMRDSSKLKKALGVILGLGLLGGIVLAFVVELFLDPSIKRAADIESKLQMPVFLSIKDTDWKGPRGLFGSARNGQGRRALQMKNGSPGSTELLSGKNTVATWDPGHSLRPYYEAMRDRLLSHFESRNMTRKPKLVAVTSCSEGSGVTTLASGLAATLSETGDGNVLLVDMNLEEGAAHPFHRGKPQCALPDVLERSDKRDAAMVQENLYIVSATTANDNTSRLLPKKFAEFFPKFKASDYDYIIFDMPPISETSMTPRLAGFMDAVLLVIESEKTNRQAAKRASVLLSQSKSNLLTILNKTKTYVPKWLHQEF